MVGLMHPFDEAFHSAFVQLYERYCPTYLKGALVIVNRVLDELTVRTFDASRVPYVQVQTGRIKSAARLYLKAQRPPYVAQIDSPEDVFKVVLDVVGSRVVCSTIADVYRFGDAVESAVDRADTALSRLNGTAPRDYISRPEPSGYRAYHLNVTVSVAGDEGILQWPAEIQVRTLLQEAWAKLTYEETYPHDAELPPEIRELGRRLGTGLAAMEPLAQELSATRSVAGRYLAV
jgi:ppGpp synthetase/RelA/SpoT-type nucleotidyltranferase